MAFRGVDGPPKQGTLTIQGVPKKTPLSVVLITTGEPNELQKMYNYLEKAEVISFLQIVVYFLQHIWFARGDQKNIAKIAKNCQKSPIIADFDHP